MHLSLLLISGFMLVVGSTALQATYYDVDQAEQLFEDFIETHNKVYTTQDGKQMRLEIFKGNLYILNKLNAIGGAVFTINHFSDFTKEELKQRMGLKSLDERDDENDVCKLITGKDITSNKAPQSINWVAKGAVTPVNDQGDCGSCYAFSTVGNIEGQYFIKTKQLLSLSKQAIVDCSELDDGCQGGFEQTAMTELIRLGGIELESSYPYKDKEQICQFNRSNVAVKLKGCTKYLLKDENKLKEVLANRGPLAIGVNGDYVDRYSTGIMTVDHCPPKDLNHAVLLVGYGTSSEGIDYWLLKNSWGTKFGESGYFKLKRGQNTCGLLNDYAVSADL